MSAAASYLAPYRDAVRKHGAGFASLLWASPATQATRFEALTRLADCRGRNVLDVGCGRADFLDFLMSRDLFPAHYVGVEAVPELADAAMLKNQDNALILRADFVREPIKLFVGADVVVFSGSLNTLDTGEFYNALDIAWEATAGTLAFNFLSSTTLAAASYLTWHEKADVLNFARLKTAQVRAADDYLEGDCTIAMFKVDE